MMALSLHRSVFTPLLSFISGIGVLEYAVWQWFNLVLEGEISLYSHTKYMRQSFSSIGPT